jgi:TetR/AcrR family transcriptional repressor of nem operon
MRVSRETMARHHEQIVASAAAMLKERGIDGLSVADLMQSAGLTHGGFYRHFASKDVLVAEATTAAFAAIIERLNANAAKGSRACALHDYIAEYLSPGHVETPAAGCPIAAYGAEIFRQSDVVREAYAEGLDGVTTAIANCFAEPPAHGRRLAQAIISAMVGAVVTARAAGNHKVTKSHLAAARSTVDRLVASGTLKRAK